MDLRNYTLWYGVTGGLLHSSSLIARNVNVYKPVFQYVRECFTTLGARKQTAAEPIFYGIAIPSRLNTRYEKIVRDDLVTKQSSYGNFDRRATFPSRGLCLDFAKNVKISSEGRHGMLFHMDTCPLTDALVPFEFGTLPPNQDISDDAASAYDLVDILVDHVKDVTEKYQHFTAINNDPKNRNILSVLREMWVSVYKLRKTLPISNMRMGDAARELYEYYVNTVLDGRSIEGTSAASFLKQTDLNAVFKLPRFRWHKVSRVQLQRSKENVPLSAHDYIDWKRDYFNEFGDYNDLLYAAGGSLLMRYFKGGINYGIYNLFTLGVTRCTGRDSTAFMAEVAHSALAESLYEDLPRAKQDYVLAFNAFVHPKSKFHATLVSDTAYFSFLRVLEGDVDLDDETNFDAKLSPTYARVLAYAANWDNMRYSDRDRFLEGDYADPELDDLYFEVHIKPLLAHRNLEYFVEYQSPLSGKTEGRLFDLKIADYIVLREFSTILSVLYHWAKKNKHLLRQDYCPLRMKLWELISHTGQSLNTYIYDFLERDSQSILGISIKQYLNNTGRDFLTNIVRLYAAITSANTLATLSTYNHDRKYGSLSSSRSLSTVSLFDVNQWMYRDFGRTLHTYNRKDKHHNIDDIYQDTLLTLLSTL